MKAAEKENSTISKKGYRKFRFDQIVFNISERVEPKDTELEVYVGLEHLDPESIHIKRFGKPTDVEGTKLKVYPGDLIFGKRRAYQRKAAIANFEGICSAHAMVLRANPKVILPELFPFFIHSDLFMHRAIDISVGSLSPTINWGTLKTQEFLLPPLEQQAKLAELLWAGDVVVREYNKLSYCLIKTLESSRRKHFLDSKMTNKLIKKGFEITRIITKGSSPNWQGFNYVSDGTLFITSENVLNGKLDLSEKKYLPLEFHNKLKNSQLRFGDILINIVGASIGRACIYNLEIENANVNQAVCVFRVIDDINPKFILNYLLTKEIQDKLLMQQSNTARANLSLTDFREFDFYCPSIKTQNSIVKQLDNIIDIMKQLELQTNTQSQIQKQLINQIFS